MLGLEPSEKFPLNLVERISSGDKTAEQELVEKYWHSLFFIVNRQAKNPDLAADITQDALITVINHSRDGKIDNPDAIAQYIRQVGMNMLIAHYRKENRHKVDSSEQIDVEFPDLSSDIPKEYAGIQMKKIVIQLMDDLPTDRDKDILLRHFVYDQSKKDICNELNITQDHFDKVLYRIRARLKQIIQVKLGVDLSKSSISQFLSLALILNCLLINDIENSENLDTVLVRENPSKLHLYVIEVKDGHGRLPGMK